MKHVVASLVVICSFFAATANAHQPQSLCDVRDSILAALAARYREAPAALGVTSGGILIEVLTSEEGKTWTIIVTHPNGVTCLVFSGEGWRRERCMCADRGVS